MQAVAIINFVLKPDLCEPGMLTGKGAALRATAKESRVAAAAVQTSARRSALGGPHTGGETSSGCDRIVLEDLTAVVVELRKMHCGRLDEISKSLYNYIMTCGNQTVPRKNMRHNEVDTHLKRRSGDAAFFSYLKWERERLHYLPIFLGSERLVCSIQIASAELCSKH